MRTLIVNPKSRGLTATALLLATSFAFVSVAPALGPQCTVPYVQVQDGATPLLPDPNMNYTIQSVSMGEPFVNCSTKRLTIVMKVPSLSPAPPPNASWTVDFVTDAITAPGGGQGTPQTIFVEYSTTINPAGGFNWGFHDTINDINLSQCLPLPGQPCEVTGTATPDGTITMHFVLTTALPLSGLNGEAFGSLGGAAWTPGRMLSLIRGHTDLFVGAAGTGFSVANAATTGDGVYTVQGNVPCSDPPVAALAADVTSGNAPLTVNFNASASNIPTGGCGTIVSYIFDFGDGDQTTQATPTVSHTYNNPGTYPARVRVVSSLGVTSGNIAEQVITVTGGGPQVSSIVSRMTHGGTLDFDIVLPQPPAPRNVECRSGGAGGNFKLVFTFLNNVTSVAGASVTAGAGSVLNSGLGPNSNQFTVNLTGVTNAQSTTVTLQNVLDSSGALGNVSAIIGVLLGDTTGNGSVNSTDIGQTKIQSGNAASSSNFRTDINASGLINSTDISTVKLQSGTALPP